MFLTFNTQEHLIIQQHIYTFVTWYGCAGSKETSLGSWVPVQISVSISWTASPGVPMVITGLHLDQQKSAAAYI